MRIGDRAPSSRSSPRSTPSTRHTCRRAQWYGARAPVTRRATGKRSYPGMSEPAEELVQRWEAHLRARGRGAPPCERAPTASEPRAQRLADGPGQRSPDPGPDNLCEHLRAFTPGQPPRTHTPPFRFHPPPPESQTGVCELAPPAPLPAGGKGQCEAQRIVARHLPRVPIGPALQAGTAGRDENCGRRTAARGGTGHERSQRRKRQGQSRSDGY
jgi:hypothetical protein